VGAGLALAILWGGLVLTFSQSSFAGLLLGLAVLGALRWGTRRALAVAGAMVAVGAAVVLLAPGLINLELSGSDDLDSATSGRYDLVAGGVALAGDRPLLGHGSGSFAREYRRAEDASAQRASSASHTTPITVAAEQGRRRPGRLPGARRARPRPPRARRARVARPDGHPRGVLRAAGAHDALRGVPRGPADVDAARGRHGARGGGGPERSRAPRGRAAGAGGGGAPAGCAAA
jgi:hypothetical protein